MHASLDPSNKSIIENMYEARHFRMHKQRVANLDFCGMSVLEPHSIASRKQIEDKKTQQKICHENALMIQKLREANEGKGVSDPALPSCS